MPRSQRKQSAHFAAGSKAAIGVDSRGGGWMLRGRYIYAGRRGATQRNIDPLRRLINTNAPYGAM